MRRPSPLPQSPVASRGAADSGAQRSRERDDSARPSAADGNRPDAVDAADLRGAPTGTTGMDAADAAELPAAAQDVTAPIIPLASPASAPPWEEEVEADDIGFREVWKAARARRKALRAEIRRFTVRQRRRRAVWLGVAASLLLLALATIGAAYSPLFAVQKISVVGTQQLDADELADALAGQLGTPLPLVDESAVKAELVAFPLIETYALEARPPHELVIRIVERTPIGLIETRAGYTLVDAAGVALTTTATPSAGTPVLDITGGVHSDAFVSAGQVMRSLPADIRAQVTEVRASTPDDVTLTLGGTNTQVVWGSAEHSAAKALNLAKTMLSRSPADVSVYDVTSPDVVVVR